MEIMFSDIQELHHFIGPFLRNKIQSKTKKFKREIDVKCQNPNCIENDYEYLDAAHKHGYGRREMIEKELNKHKTPVGYTITDLDAFIDSIIEKSNREIFIFLCRKCHVKYDKLQIQVNL